jgi:hypothetical protein
MESPARKWWGGNSWNPPLRCGASYTPPGHGPNGLGPRCDSAHLTGIMGDLCMHKGVPDYSKSPRHGEVKDTQPGR